MRAIVVFLLCLSLCQGGQVITFDLSSYDPSNRSTEVQKEFVNLTEGLTEIQVTNVPDDIGFFIVQVHTYLNNVTLSSTSKFKAKTTIRGTNVGLVDLDLEDTTFYLRTQNQTDALIVVIIYKTKDPVPGGCNLTFDTENAPYQLISYTDDLIIVESQPPSVNGQTCEKNNITVELYHLFLHEHNYEQSYYFSGLQKMLTVDAIKLNGYRVNSVDGYFKYRKLYSAYRGVGQVFAIIATLRNRSSAYIPAASYGCDLNNIETCKGPVTLHWKLICAVQLIVGAFVCFFGHKFFRLNLYVMGFASGIFITYVVLSFNNNLTIAEKTTTSMLIGLIYGSAWLLVWWKFGIPILSVSFTFLMAGFLMASIIYYTGVADFTIFHNEINFWLTFSAIVVAFFILWSMFTLRGHVFACSFLGAYACVAALNYYTVGNLQYIVINSFRRIVVRNFNMATVDPPFQILDIAHSVLWLVMTGSGFYYQMREQRNKPPFPPHRYATVQEGVDETTPLVANNAVFYSDI